MLSLLSGDGQFFRRQLPLGLISANVACLVFLMSLFAVKDDFREVAYYIANGTSIFTVGGLFGLLGLVLAQLPPLPSGNPRTSELFAMMLIALSACLLVAGLFLGDNVIRGVANGSIASYEAYLKQEKLDKSTPAETWVK